MTLIHQKPITMDKRKIKGIAMHCSAMIKSTDQKDLNHFYENYWRLKPNQIDLFQGLTDEVEICQVLWHEVRGWTYPGYHRLIKNDATVQSLLSFDIASNGVGGYNKEIINICYNGGVIRDGNRYIDNVDTRTDKQKAAEMDCILDAILYAGNSSIYLKGHRDFAKDVNGDGVIDSIDWVKSCPNYSVSKDYGWVTV